jgi:hypothetical protein
MTSVLTNYSQRDNRLENVTLTGFVSNNGGKSGSITEQRPAYAAIDLTKSKNFSIDTRVLTLRTDSPTYFLLRIYISSSKPPSYYQNFEFDIFITPPDDDANYLYIEIYADEENAENASIIGSGYKRLYAFTNITPSDDYSNKTGIVTFKVLNNSIILKNIPPDFSY